MKHEEQLYQKDLFIQKLEQKLEEKYKEIIKLNKILDSQERHIANMEKYFRGLRTKRTGNVITDFELLIRKQVCDEIRAFFDVNPNTVEWDYLNEILNDIEQGE